MERYAWPMWVFRYEVLSENGEGKGKTNHVQAWTGPEVSRRLRSPGFHDNRHMKVVKVASTTHRPPLLPQEIFLVLISVKRG